MNKMYDVKDLIREVRLKAYYESLTPNFISSIKVSATLHVEVEKKAKNKVYSLRT
jgi:hypothetical protein